MPVSSNKHKTGCEHGMGKAGKIEEMVQDRLCDRAVCVTEFCVEVCVRVCVCKCCG